jgi:hypothetical protein
MTKHRAFFRLSLSQRERIEVRDCSESVPQALTKLPPERYRVLPEFDDSKNAPQRCLVRPETPLVRDRVFRAGSSHDLNHRARLRVLWPDNKNPECKDRWDAAAGICNGQTFDFEDGAKECVRSPSRFCGDSGGGTLSECLANAVLLRRRIKIPLTSILSPESGRGGFQPAYS